MEELGLRHRPSGANARFEAAGLPFAEYVQRTQAMLRRVHAGKPALEKIVAGNSPFELRPAGDFPKGRDKPYKRGVLLTHGLTDSPYFMRHLAAFFQRNGFRVMAVLLPGHGTRPGDTLEVRWQEWAKAVAYGVECLAAEADELYLAGFSAGAALNILHALDDARVRGLFLFSPALELPRRAKFAHWHRWYSWLMPSAQWAHVRPDADIYKYESLSKNSVAQVYALSCALGARLQERGPDIPVFAAASADDVTVHTPATVGFMARARHPGSRLVLYTTAPGDPPPGIPPERLELVDSRVPVQRIVSSAHTAIVLPPDDAHYGAAGEYVNCQHYYEDDREKYDACKNGAGGALQGEITDANLRAGILQRLMYNPNYAALEISMKRFLDSLP
jgi:alpha-beta hydrolase superfamily lysophospholipase